MNGGRSEVDASSTRSASVTLKARARSGSRCPSSLPQATPGVFSLISCAAAPRCGCRRPEPCPPAPAHQGAAPREWCTGRGIPSSNLCIMTIEFIHATLYVSNTAVRTTKFLKLSSRAHTMRDPTQTGTRRTRCRPLLSSKQFPYPLFDLRAMPS